MSFAAGLALAYLKLRNAQVRLAIASANLASQRKTLQITQWRQQAALAGMLADAAPVPQPSGDLALSIPAETLRQRADVRSAEHQIGAAQAQPWCCRRPGGWWASSSRWHGPTACRA